VAYPPSSHKRGFLLLYSYVPAYLAKNVLLLIQNRLILFLSMATAFLWLCSFMRTDIVLRSSRVITNHLSAIPYIGQYSFYAYFIVKDLVTIIFVIVIFIIVNLQNPYILRDPDNFKIANPIVTPSHIKPE
ncbi:unnamed protein product, partial [Heterotrigona itama]